MVTAGSLRSIATVVQIDGGSFETIVEAEGLASAWEYESASETSAGNIARMLIELHELAAMPKASQRLLDDAAFDVEGWIAERIAARALERVYRDHTSLHRAQALIDTVRAWR